MKKRFLLSACGRCGTVYFGHRRCPVRGCDWPGYFDAIWLHGGWWRAFLKMTRQVFLPWQSL